MQRVDAYEKVTGRAIYADDISMEGMLYAVPLHAAYPHAKILSIDATHALKVEGVIDVITAKDVPGDIFVGPVVQDQYLFAKDKTLYSGDVVAMVAGEALEAARAGRDAIKVEYQPLDPILSPLDALKSQGIHPEREDNVVSHSCIRHGDVKLGFAKADKVIEREFRTQFVEHAYLEPESCIAVANPDDSVTVWGGMQHPFTTRRFVAWGTGLSLSKVRIIQTTLGGGFGGKDDTISCICARAAILAMRTRRPVKVTYTREESIRESYKRHPFIARYKVGAKKDGTLTALEADITLDSGPYTSTSPYVIWRPTVQCAGPYIYPNVKTDSRAVRTNNTFTGAMRGFGTPQINFVIESMMDIIAVELGMDPIELRRKNFFRQGATTHTGQKLDKHTVSISQVVDTVLRRFEWDEKFKRCSRGVPDKDGKYYGVGMGCSYRGVSLGAEGNDFCAAIVNIQPDGSILLETGVAENGQGLKTAMAHICATELGVTPDRIIYKDVDTSSVPDSCPTVASRGTLVGGNAVLDAVRKLKSRMEPVLGELIGAPTRRTKDERTKGRRGNSSLVPRPSSLVEDDYIYKSGRITNPTTGKSISFDELVAACYARRIYLHALGVWQGSKVSWDEATGQGDAYFTYVYGCQAAEIEVDGKTGKTAVKKVVAAHDMGRAINPQMAIGQIYGGVVMGLGFALKEEVIHKDGVIQNTNFDKYKIMTSREAPEMEAIIIENPDPEGPWGAKALGEPTNELMGAAIANAVYWATGVRVTELPIKPEELRETLFFERASSSERVEKPL